MPLVTLALSLLATGAQEVPAPRPAVEPGFRHESGRIPVGRVHRYRKSNLDGSNPSEIALHLASETRLESLKWHPGAPEATLVVAEMDWEVGSVAGFRNYRVDEHGERHLQAELATHADRTRLVGRASGGPELVCAFERFPWHSYDFDFASLNVSLRFLVDPAGEVEFDVIDAVQGARGVELVVRGGVVLAYEGEEERSGLPCRRYVLDGPGLEDRGGALWAAREGEVFLVAFELDLPDEPGMTSGRLEWLRNETAAPAEWEAFVRTRKDSVAR